ncbi:MAG: Effector protein HopM1 [Pseudomonas fluorescens]|nr:MAG: Effector protein HopM1 [Pseudomonas fluorescens]
MRTSGIHPGTTPAITHTEVHEAPGGDIALVRLSSRPPTDLAPSPAAAPSATLKSYAQRQRPSAPLAKEAAVLAQTIKAGTGSKLDIAQAMMVLEGKYLLEQSHAAFQTIAEKLFPEVNEHLSPVINDELLTHAQNARLELQKALSELSKMPGNTPDVAAYSRVLKDAINAQTELFAGKVALYQEVLSQPELSATDRAHIERSEHAFARFAQQAATQIPSALKQASAKADATVKALHHLHQPAREWEDISHQLKTLVRQTSTEGEFKDALDNARLPDVLDGLHQHNDGWAATTKAFVAGAVPQMLASGLAFGFARAVVESAIPHDLPKQVLAAGVTMAAAHEVGTNLLKPIGQELVGPWNLKPVKASEVIPNPNPRVSIQGQIQPLSDEAKTQAKHNVDALRSRHLNAQQANKNGTGIGEAQAFAAFGLAQGIRRAIGFAAPQLHVNDYGPRTLTSMGGGLLMGGVQSSSQLRSTTPDARGRELPTHTFKGTDKPLAQRIAKAASDAVLASDPSKSDVRQSLLSKTFGSLIGLGNAVAVGTVARAIGTHTPAQKFGQVVMAALGSPALLIPAYAAFQSGPETKAHTAALKAQQLPGTQTPAAAPNFPRTRTALQNVLSPDRADLPHGSLPGTWGRTAENTYHRVRGGLQIASQIPTETIEHAPQLIKAAPAALASAASAVHKAVSGSATAVDTDTDPQPPGAFPLG